MIVNLYKNSRLFCFLWILLCFYSTVSFPQTPKINFSHLTVEDGLSQSTVFSIAQDSMGFMWFGTKDGLNKFNTQGFEVYRHNKKDPNSISSSQNINALLTDRKGQLWIATQNGLNLYIPESNNFKHFLHDPADPQSISNNVIRSLYQDRQGNLWVGTEQGLNQMLPSGKFRRFYGKDKGGNLANSLIKTIHQDFENTLWVGGSAGLTSMELRHGNYRFKSYFHDPGNQRSIINNDVTTIYEDHFRNLWIGTHNNGLELFDRKGQSFTHFSLKKGQNDGLRSNVIRKMKMDHEGRLWISTLNGLNILDLHTRKFTAYVHNPEDPSSLNQNSIYDIMLDRAGSMWLGSYYGGINVFHANSTPFKKYRASPGKNGISSNVISVITEDASHNLWIGTEAEGLNYYNRSTGQFSNFKSDIYNPNSLSSNLVKAILIDKKQKVWLGTYEGGLDKYDPKSGQFSHYRPADQPNSLHSNRIVCLSQDHTGKIWIGTRSHGIYWYNEQQNNFTVFEDPRYSNELKFVRCFFEDAAHNFWIGTNSGTFVLKKGASRLVQFSNPQTDFAFDDINFIREDTKGNIWMGSYQSGLIKHTPSNQHTQFFTMREGLPANNVLGLLEDDKAEFWISTSNGLAKYNGHFFINYTVQDGLTGNVFNYNSFFKDAKGELFFGGYNGLVSFFPEQIKRNTTSPGAVFTQLRLFNKAVAINDESKLLTKSIHLSKAISFSYDQNIFSIDFAILNYIKSEKNRYAYKLEGFEKDWNYVSTPSATFTNLPSGSYSLLIKGANNDGVWTEKPERLIIHVKPPLWKTWWAYLIYVVLIMGLIFLVLRFLWIRALLRREHEVFQMKLDFFTNVSHEIRTPLTLIVGPLENLVEESQESPALHRKLLDVKRNAGRLTRLVTELMDFRKAESGKLKLNVAPANIVSFAKEIFLSFGYLSLQKQITYTFDCSAEVIEVYFDGEQLEKVFFNLLSNAFKFTPDQGSIRLQISANADSVEVLVADSGTGIPEASRDKIFTNFYQVREHRSGNTGTGIGLALAEKISKLHHGSLILLPDERLSDPEMHTCFSLKLKLGSQHFKKDDLAEDFVDIEAAIHYREEIEPLAEEDILAEYKANAASILIVEDNDEIRTFISRSLSPYFRVIEARDGLEGLAKALELIPDLIVSDVMMPNMDGLELCRTIKTDLRTSHIPVILLTARSGNIHELKGLKTGAEAYVTKPFSIHTLQLNINNLLNLQVNMRRKFSQQMTLQPSNVIIESTDQDFLNKMMTLIEGNLSNEAFGVNELASELGMSTPILYKKVKAMTGFTVNNFIKSVRLQRAAQLLQQGTFTVYEVAYMVGFSSSKYFSKEFAKQFSRSPSDYVTARD